ncbi:hypothetical protein ACGFXC_08955 [Streptomyces sp. NPDC048507]|uniref:hypothetical protein n=1 Tax=Streptomyces sp. NPDC048507 TaxID=3365560 RepID=UPI003712B7C4
MTDNRGKTGAPHHERLLHDTDWASLTTAGGTGSSLPTALARLLDPDPAVRASAARSALREVTHQNSFYGATAPVARYVAAVLAEPALTATDFDLGETARPDPPALVLLLTWLADTTHDASLTADGQYLEEYAEVDAFRNLRPVLFDAVRPLLGHPSPEARTAALLAAIPLTQHPLLTGHTDELAGHARRLLATSPDRHGRDRALEALRAWGHDTRDLETPADTASREHHTHLQARQASRTGGYTQAPPF